MIQLMSTIERPKLSDGLSLRQAALIAGIAYLLNPVSYAEFTIFPKLIVAGDIERTAQNIIAHDGLFLIAIGCYLISFIGDVVIAWALYYLLRPVSRPLSMLMAWFQLVYAAIALGGVVNLVSVHSLLISQEYLNAFGAGPLHAQVMLLIHTFRYTWSLALVLFGIHLVLLGGLIYRSGYIPKILGALLVINGLGWMIACIAPYAFSGAHLGYVQITVWGELFFMLWLLIWGWRLPEPAWRR